MIAFHDCAGTTTEELWLDADGKEVRATHVYSEYSSAFGRHVRELPLGSVYLGEVRKYVRCLEPPVVEKMSDRTEKSSLGAVLGEIFANSLLRTLAK